MKTNPKPSYSLSTITHSSAISHISNPNNFIPSKKYHINKNNSKNLTINKTSPNTTKNLRKAKSTNQSLSEIFPWSTSAMSNSFFKSWIARKIVSSKFTVKEKRKKSKKEEPWIRNKTKPIKIYRRGFYHKKMSILEREFKTNLNRLSSLSRNKLTFQFLSLIVKWARILLSEKAQILRLSLWDKTLNQVRRILSQFRKIFLLKIFLIHWKLRKLKPKETLFWKVLPTMNSGHPNHKISSLEES